MAWLEHCSRCSRAVKVGSREFSNGQTIKDQYLCGRCLTPENLAPLTPVSLTPLTDRGLKMLKALREAGLREDDRASMTGDELDMREGLAHLLYEHDREPE